METKRYEELTQLDFTKLRGFPLSRVRTFFTCFVRDSHKKSVLFCLPGECEEEDSLKRLSSPRPKRFE